MNRFTVHGYNFTLDSCNDDVTKIKIRQSTFNPAYDLNVNPNKLNYRLYTRSNPEQEILLTTDNYEKLNPMLETKILLHGWLEGHDRPFIIDMKNIYLFKREFNVIIPDWDAYVDVPYIYVVPTALGVGKELGDFLVNLSDLSRIDLSNTHIVGHSLGAHIAGVAGKQIYSRTGRKVARISSLDAAGPLFNGNHVSRRIDAGDADFVDAIHTNGFVAGYKRNYASVDFYVNGGVFQPGCKSLVQFLNSRITCTEAFKFGK